MKVRSEDSAVETQHLRELLAAHESAIEAVSHGLCRFGPDERLIFCNQLYRQIYGLAPAAAAAGAAYRDILRAVAHADATVDADALYARRIDLVRRGAAATDRLVLGDGRVIETRLRPVAGGGWVGEHEDITARLREENALREQIRMLDGAIEHMAHGLCAFDQDMQVVVRNQRYLDMYKLTREESKPGTTLLDLMRGSVRRGVHLSGVTAERMFADFKQRLIDNKEPVLRRVLADGTIVAVRHQQLTNGGWVGTYEDITALEHAWAALRDQNLRFDAALNNMSQGLCMFDADNRLIVSNARYLTMFDADTSIVKPGATLREIFEHGVARGLYQGTVDELLERRLSALAERRPAAYDQELTDGRVIAVSLSPMPDGGWVGTFEDITKRRKAEAERAAAVRELHEQYRRFDAALNNMSQGLCMLDADLRVIVCNRRYTELLGLSPEVAKPGASVREIIAHSVARGNHAPLTVDAIYRSYLDQLRGGSRISQRELADGRVIEVVHQSMPSGGWIETFEDITERRRSEAHIARMARHDSLTDLPNRLLFREKMAEGLGRVARLNESMAVLYLDLDNFKTVNDTLGHPFGDKLLCKVAERLGAAIGEQDTIARLGGDEFAILQGPSGTHEAEALARRVAAAMAEPIVIDGHEINSGLSIGIALAPDDGTSADHLMKSADLALYHAKADGRGSFRFFQAEMDAQIQARRALEIDLRRALTNGEFHLVFQPQLHLATNQLVGMEALLRWSHEERGLVSPAEFIPVAEETGLIVPLGEWVLRRACAEAARWPHSIKVAVNLSPVQFRSRGLVTMVTHALAAAGLPASRLELEITEAVLLQKDEAIVEMLHQLRTLGIRISMDDFGTGYSSLSYLRSFPFDKIKIDRSFISDLDRNPDSAAIVRAIAELGATLGIETTAEGVETPEQLDLVRRAGCTEVQGYLISKPRQAAEIQDLIARLRRDDVAAA
jgi:diguanylate cyclase (GGDEF)-like protein